jgi:hypothetical protein
MKEFYLRVGIDRTKGSYLQYVGAHKHLQRFIKSKYKVRDIPLAQLDLSFIENFDFYLRIEQRLMPASVNGRVVILLSVMRMALHRNLVSTPPFFGYKLERPKFQVATKCLRWNVPKTAHLLKPIFSHSLFRSIPTK